jgi:hypothetical protein
LTLPTNPLRRKQSLRSGFRTPILPPQSPSRAATIHFRNGHNWRAQNPSNPQVFETPAPFICLIQRPMIVSVAGGNDKQLNWGARLEYNIRQLSFAEVLDRSLRILVDNAVLLIGVALLVGMPIEALPRGRGWPEVLRWAFTLSWVPFAGAALASATADIYLGRHATIRSAFKTAWSILFRYLGTYLIVEAVFLPIFGLVLVSTMLTTRPDGGIHAIIGLVFLVWLPIAFILWTRWILHGPVMVVERRFGMSALRRSSALVKGAWWRTVGILLISLIVELVPARIFRLLTSSVPVVGTLIQGLVFSFSYAYLATVVTVYYFDRRCRLEDFDLRYLAEQIRAEGSQTPATAKSDLGSVSGSSA